MNDATDIILSLIPPNGSRKYNKCAILSNDGKLRNVTSEKRKRIESNFLNSLPSKILQGGRHNAMVSYTVLLWSIGNEENAIREKLTLFDKKRNSPPKDDPEEIDGIVSWVVKLPQGIHTYENIDSDGFPEELPPSVKVLVRGLPRSGKSHHFVTLVVTSPGTANVIAPSHAICEQHVRMFLNLVNTGETMKTAVHLVGMDRTCTHKPIGNCKKCELYPYNSQTSFLSYRSEVSKYLCDHHFVDSMSVPEGHCKYHFLKTAELSADLCFTVAAYLGLENSLQDRDILLIDEDTSVVHLYPQSFKIAEYYNFRGEKNIDISPMTKCIDEIDRWIKYYEKHPKSQMKKAILEIFSIVKNIFFCLETGRHENTFTVDAVLQRLSEKTTTVTLSEEDIEKAIRKIKKFKRSGEIVALALAICYPYQNMQFLWTGKQHKALFAVADESRLVCTLKWDKLIVIGATRGRMLMEHLGGNCATINSSKFPFAKNFIVLKIKKENEVNYRMSAIQYLKKFNADSIKRSGFFIATGSTHDAIRIHKNMGDASHIATDGGLIAHQWSAASGVSLITTANSRIARGIDVDYTRSLIYSLDFSLPYFYAHIESAKLRQNKDEAAQIQRIIDEIITDESTNLFLRISPVQSDPENAKIPRIVIISEDDLGQKISPLALDGMRIIETSFNNIERCHETILGMTGYAHLEADKTIGHTVVTPTASDLNKMFETLAKVDFRKKDRYGNPLEIKFESPRAHAKISEIRKKIIERIERENKRGRNVSRKGLINRIHEHCRHGGEPKFPNDLIDHTISLMIKEQILLANSSRMDGIIKLRKFYPELPESLAPEI